MTITVYHNPACGTSRNVLAIVRSCVGDGSVTVVPYLTQPPSADRLRQLYDRAGLTPREGMRTKGDDALIEELGLLPPDRDPARDANRILAAMAAHPILISRPLVETPMGVVLARPCERVAEVLDNPPKTWTKENGDVIHLRS
ncbi:arsenate reductase [Jannaschia pagri]|uniref:Arsenate reductase n=1 Tax=Jannaschia pagri TaxID=2829797 RepID=A0ABQ4NLY5_9RHOB|nr:MULTISPECIES: arsenate reductase family protein [unclassified Jannaschia]GIT91591.1 arsenate reductase [Jannaschia sp. AI_61]GIT95425.1 arsenate reductase [Jannaschia sp. AI_62]